MRFLALLGALVFAVPAAALETKAKQAVILDYETGAVLFSKSADDPMYPASMTKMLTVYIVFEDIKAGRIKLTDTFHISENAWQMGNPQLREGSNMFVALNSNVAIEDLLRGVIIQSGNDACIALAEGISGSVPEFSKRMNATAKKIGMTQTNFTNPDGWPDPAHVTTAHDLAILAYRLIHDFPEFYHYFSEPEFTYNNIRQGNRNLLLGSRNYKVDGLKTGHTEASGFGMTVSGIDKNNHRLIVVVNGLSSMKERASEAEAVLTYGFTNFEMVKLVSAGQTVATLPVHLGAVDQVNLVTAKDLNVPMARGAEAETTYAVRSKEPIAAPIKKGDELGTLVIHPKDMPEQTVSLVAGEDVAKAGFFRKVILNLKALGKH